MLEMNGSLKDLTFLGFPLTGWRLAFLFGTIPAAIALLVRRQLKEPERWAETSTQKRGSYRELFGTPRWRYNALIGLGIGIAAVVGLWGIGFFGVQLAMGVITENLKAEGLQGLELSGRVKIWGGLYSFFLNLGAAFGMIFFGYLAQRLNRRMAFFLSFSVAMITTAATFWNFNHSSQTFWLTPLMGFCLLSVFAVLAIYFPELFPTRLRSTGTWSATSFLPRKATARWKACGTQALSCAVSSSSASRCCPLRPRPRANRCRNSRRGVSPRIHFSPDFLGFIVA
jgi:MFS family permease